MLIREDTIAAIATAPGNAAIGIVRISGPRAGDILQAVIPGISAFATPRKVCFGAAVDPESKKVIDEVLCFHCKGPNTATGEDVSEIHGHGGRYVMKKLLDAALKAGAVIAEPGEFTYRAYRNGKLDLTQAEAVIALIGASSKQAADIAIEQLDGSLGRSLEKEFDALMDVSAQLEAGLDFPDEDLDLKELRQIKLQLGEIKERLIGLKDSYVFGSRLSKGARVVIVGPTNAGKSSLLNRLVEQDRALVDPEPGTTRDVIEAACEIDGIGMVFLDTAGLRSGANRVEQRGIEKTLRAIETADTVIVVVDGCAPVADYIHDISALTHRSAILAINKADLPNWTDPVGLVGAPAKARRIPTSAVSGQGLDELKRALVVELSSGMGDDARILTTARQHSLVAECVEHIQRAENALKQDLEPELAAADLRFARDALAKLWGRNASEDMLGKIFDKFCIGK